MLAFVFSSIITRAQQTASLKGIIKDGNGQTLSAVTVILRHAPDSALVKADVTDDRGKFEFPHLVAGNYLLDVSLLGYRAAPSPVFTVKDGGITDAGTLLLTPATKELSGVTVKAAKPLVEVKLDKTILNVEGSINAIGSNAMELLTKSPGVVVDKDDNISLKGKSGVRIYIDGRLVPMTSKDLAIMLRSMNSADIESLEFISTPSAKYDASGNAGIINIKLRKDKRYGINGNFTTGLNIAVTPKNNNSISGNYRNKIVNIFGSYSNNFGIVENYINQYRYQKDSIYDSRAQQPADSKVHNFKAGADFSLGKYSTLGFIVTGNISNVKTTVSSVTPISSEKTGVLARTLIAGNELPDKRKNFNYNGNYRFADTSGNELNIDLDLGSFESRASSFQPNTYVYPDGTSVQSIYRNNTPIDIDMFVAKLDYEKRLWGGKFGVGGKFSDVNTTNVFEFYDVIDEQDKLNTDNSNKFTYKENINALYVNYNRSLNSKWTMQAGLRAEHTHSEGNLTSYKPDVPDNLVKRNYLDLFPGAAISYAHNDDHQFSLAYSRRIERPSYQDLNPFENKLDELNYQKGNAFLRPQYTNTIEISHVYKYKITTTLGYSHISDLMATITDTADGAKAYLINENVASQDLISLNVSISTSITKWWSLYTNINANHSSYRGIVENKQIAIDAYNCTVYLQNTFTLGKGFTAQLSGWGSSPFVWGGTYRNNAMGGIDIGLQRRILKDKGAVKVSLTDVAHSMKWSGVSDFAGMVIHADGGWESRQLRINFSYRFGSKEIKEARQRKTAIEDENNRIKSK